MQSNILDAKQAVPESVYYARHLRLPGFTAATQDKLRQARVLIIGVGGLGCPAALYLAGAGVGTLGLCDADTVSATNLHRQVLFDANDIGQKKVDVAARRLLNTNPHIRVECHASFADADTLRALVSQYDLVLDGTDNFAAKYAINDACAAARVPLVYGSIFQFEGQVSVFHQPTSERAEGYSYRDVYPDAPPAGLSQNCGEAGVVGVLPGIIGTLQANEVIKVLTGLGEPLSGVLLMFDALGATSRRLRIRPRAQLRFVAEAAAMNEPPAELAQEALQATLSQPDATLLDVREIHERAQGHLGGLHIPLAQLPARFAELPSKGTLVVYCKSGVRSAKAGLYLRSVLPALKVLSLRGGMDGATCAI